MLEVTLSARYVPGTNLKGARTGAGWLYALPSLDLRRVLCVGPVPSRTLVALASAAAEVLVLAEGTSSLRTLAARFDRHGFQNVRAVERLGDVATAGVDLVVLRGEGLGAASRPDDVQDLQRLLSERGVVFADLGGRLRRRHLERQLATIRPATTRLWLTPLTSEACTVVPADDAETGTYFVRAGLRARSLDVGALKRSVARRVRRGDGRDRLIEVLDLAALEAPTLSGPAERTARRSIGKRLRSPVEQRLRRAVRPAVARTLGMSQTLLDVLESWYLGRPRFGGLGRRNAVLACPTDLAYPADLDLPPAPAGPAGVGAASAPRWLRDLATGNGVDLDSHLWGLSARGEYSSRKVLVYLFDPIDRTPDLIVKVTRDPALNPRLENEHRALITLAERGLTAVCPAPQVAFAGHHGGLSVVAETIVDGAPLDALTSGRADCPHFADALDWITRLGIASADPTLTSPTQIGAALSALLDQFAGTYRLSAAHLSFLRSQVEAVCAHPGAIPAVVQHGDAGTWNALVTPDAGTAFLDWEAAEQVGVPLWDLFYFIRTYALLGSGSAAAGAPGRGFGAQFLGDTPMRDVLAQATTRYVAEVGVPASLVEPLFHLCWVHRGLKEATRLAPRKLHKGHYLGVLAASFAQRDALRPVFDAAAR